MERTAKQDAAAMASKRRRAAQPRGPSEESACEVEARASSGWSAAS